MLRSMLISTGTYYNVVSLFYITDANECVSNPCLNGGTCEDLINEYKCVCVAGYQGTSCGTGYVYDVFMFIDESEINNSVN